MGHKVLITGASGFVGGFLVEEALHRGMTVYAAVRKNSDLQYLSDPRIQLVNLNYEDPHQLVSDLNRFGCDFIIHSAGLTNAIDPQDYIKVNVGYVQNLLKACNQLHKPLKKFTLISSLAAYGPADYTENGLVTENSIPHPVTKYGESKLLAEKHVVQQDQIPYVIIRPTAVYGPREKELFKMYQLLNYRLDISIGLADQKLTFIYVKDLVRVILDSTLAHKKNVAYFATDLKVHTASSFNQAVLKALGNKLAFKFKLPVTVVKVLGFTSEKIGKLLGGNPALKMDKVNEIEANSWICDTQPLQDDLNFKPNYSLDEGLQETMRWYKENNWIK